MRRTRLKWLISLGILVASVSGLHAQEEIEIPEQYQDRIRDLVERFEEARRLLREQIQLNADLYTQEEIDAAIARLEEAAAAAEERARLIEAEYKALFEAFKAAEADSLRYKEELAKTRAELTQEVETLQAVLRTTEVEDMIQVGPTFSASGSLGVLGLLNLPGTNLSIVAQTDYILREREARAIFGVTFSFVEQGTLVERWERFLARRRNRDEMKAIESSDG
jgi:hypothetical protein